MIYIKFTKDYMEGFDENTKLPNSIKKIIFKAKAISGKFFIKKIPNGELIVLPSTSKNSQKNLLNFLKVYSVKTVCLSKELEENNFLGETKINILNGKWLYKYLILNYIKYIATQKEERLQELEVSFLINQITELDLENIYETAKMVRNVNVITTSVPRIKKLSDKLYKENGIILNVTQNYKKSLTKSNIIINIDFPEEEINKYVIPRRAVIINIGKNTKINYKGFEGVNIFDYNVIIPKKYVSHDLDLSSFRKEILYESYLYKNTSPKNILQEIKKDNIHIESLVGQKGIIRKVEFSK